MTFHLRFSLVISAALALATAGTLSAQTLRIDGATSRTVQAAPDYAAEVMGDPWDFDAPSDYNYGYSIGEATPQDAGNEFTSWQPHPTVSNGIFSGVTREPKPSLQMLLGGIPGAMNAVQKTGARYPIDAGRYSWLSFRVKRSWAAANVETMKLLWEAGRRSESTPVGIFIFLGRGYDNDMGRWINQAPVAAQGSADQWQVYRVRLSDVHDLGQNRFGGTPWQGLMMGLGLTLGDGPIGSTLQMDWVRLTAPRAVQLSWTSLGGNVVVTATDGTQTLQVFPEHLRPQLDADTPGATAGTFADNSSLTWDYGHLTPGTWTLTATGANASRTAALVVQDVPHFTVLNPDAAGGQDMATSLIGDAWDLTNPEDVFRYATPQNALNDIKHATFTPTGLHGTAFHSGNHGAIHSDSQVRFFDDDLGAKFSLTPEQARRFHRLTFTLEYNVPLPNPLTFDPWAPEPFLTDFAKDRPGLGGMARVLWRTAADRGGAFSQTCGLPVYAGGPMTVTIDLAQYTSSSFECLDEGLQTMPAGQAWGALSSNLTNFRIDINEGRLDVPFRLSNVRLAADDEPDESGVFVVQWAAQSAPYSSLPSTATGTVNVYLDADRDPANGRTLIASGLNVSAGAYVWDLAQVPGGVAPGTYWMYVEMSRGSYTYGKYSTGPLQVTKLYDPPLTLAQWQALYGITNMSADSDGDGVSNQEEFEWGTSPLVPNRWELAEGATGFFNERVALANPEGRSATARVTVLLGQMPGEASPPAPVVQDVSIAPYGRYTLNVSGLPNATYNGQGRAVSVIVETLRGAAIVERTMSWGDSAWGGHTGKALTGGRTTWFLAEGAANDFFNTFILITSTTPNAPDVTLDYLLPDGSVVRDRYTFPSSPARLTVWANQNPQLAGKAFSTRITSTQPITVERAMYFNRAGRTFEGGHASAGIPDAATQWFVAEGTTGPGFDTWLLLANPNSSATNVTVRYLTPEGPYTATYEIGPNTRESLFVDRELSRVSGRDAIGTQIDVSAEVTSTLPIVVERAMYWFGTSNNWTDAHNSAGVTTTSTLWGLAEGENGGILAYQTFILIANPSTSDATVRLRLLREGGRTSVLSAPITVSAESRFTCYAGQPGPCQDAFAQLQDGEKFGALIESTNGARIVVERAMYWNGGGEFFGAGTNETATQLR